MIANFHPFPQLVTDRLVLRPLDTGDLDEIHELRTNEINNQYLERPSSSAKEKSEAFIKMIIDLLANNKSVYWAICLKNEPNLIGTVCLWNLVPEKDMADIGYEINPDYVGLGLMNEALQSVIQYGFEGMRLKNIIAVTHVKNKRSISLLQRNNFEEDMNFKYVSKEDAGENQVIYYLERQYTMCTFIKINVYEDEY